MPANKSNHGTPSKEKPGCCNGRKKRGSSLKHRKRSWNSLLHSEYRSTYTWHEYTGNQEHTVVRRAPQAPPTNDKTITKLRPAKTTEDETSEGPSMEPPLPRRKKCPELAYRTHEFITNRAVDVDAVDSNVVADKVREVTTKVLPASQLSKAISRISTEYRLQFAWPRRQQPALTNGEVGDDAAPRKSAINVVRQSSIVSSAPAPVHKKRQTAAVDHRRTGRDAGQASELEPLVTTDGAIREEHDEVDATYTKRERTVRITEQPLQENKLLRKTQERPFSAAEVMELRRELKRLADEYKHRDWGGGIAAEDEATLWKRVSNNHALNALSLARSATKEEKEKENTRKVGPVGPAAATNLAPAGRPSSVQARPIHPMLPEDLKPDNDRALARARKDFLIRHHLDRTTGVGDGALLPSPTREKLEPVMPRRREDQTDAQPRSLSSPKKSPRSARSQSVGPAVAERRSPKRHPQRPPSVSKDAKDKEKDKDVGEKSSERERHPRPMSAEQPQVNGQLPHPPGSAVAVSPAQPQQRGWIDDEPVVKSPPEPTRVKSPEQMIMRSPEPVNWTVPLDTGKTFTVTQNVREGEPPTRAHSETRSWGPGSITPDPSGVNKLPEHKPPAQPTQLHHHQPQLHQQQQQQSGYKSPESESVSLGSFCATNGHKDQEDSLGGRDSPSATIAKDELAQQARCLEDPVFEYESKAKIEGTSSTAGGSAAPQQEQLGSSDLLEKARNRFDKFWGKGSGEQ